MKKIFFPIVISLVSLIFIFSYQTGQLSDEVLTVVFCDVGQGDAIYIRTPGQVDILVDGGRDKKVLDCLSDNMPVWDRDIELMFATHPDADHIAGLVDVLETKWPPAQRALWPGGPREGFSSQDTNEYSLVQILRFGDFDLLLTGDITYQILDALDFEPESIEVFKLPHHGSKTGVDDSTFEKIKVSLAIISAGKNNSYHHPHPSVLALLKKFGIGYKRTDVHGSIKIVTDGKTTKVIDN